MQSSPSVAQNKRTRQIEAPIEPCICSCSSNRVSATTGRQSHAALFIGRSRGAVIAKRLRASPPRARLVGAVKTGRVRVYGRAANPSSVEGFQADHRLPRERHQLLRLLLPLPLELSTTWCGTHGRHTSVETRAIVFARCRMRY